MNSRTLVIPFLSSVIIVGCSPQAVFVPTQTLRTEEHGSAWDISLENNLILLQSIFGSVDAMWEIPPEKVLQEQPWLPKRLCGVFFVGNKGSMLLCADGIEASLAIAEVSFLLEVSDSQIVGKSELDTFLEYFEIPQDFSFELGRSVARPPSNYNWNSGPYSATIKFDGENLLGTIER